MKKVFLITQSKDAPLALRVLSDLGSVHVEHEKAPNSEEINVLKEELQTLDRIITVLSIQKISNEQIKLDEWESQGKEILELLSTLHLLEAQIAKRRIQIDSWEPWGNFFPEDIRYLSEKGIFVRFLRIPLKELAHLPKDLAVETIFVVRRMAHCFVVANREIELPFESYPLPVGSLDTMKASQKKDEEEVAQIKKRIQEKTKYLRAFQEILKELEFELKYHESLAGMGEEEGLVYLKGFCPQDSCVPLEQTAQKEKWGLVLCTPVDEDNVPTLIKNPKWINIIKPVFTMINIVPGYKEFDISVFFLLFFSVFFGMLIGDAGYGLIFIILTFLAERFMGKKVADKTPFSLMYVLSAATIIWGVLTATFFGQQWLKGIVRPVSSWLTDVNNVQMLCFLIGSVHLSIAHIWRCIVKIPSLSFLAEIGWLLIVWGMFCTAKMLILGSPFPAFAQWFFIGGVFLVVLFTQPNKNILKAVGKGMGELALNIVNTFTDVVSYIRLFAVGLATVAVADAFNEMAIGIGFHQAWAGFIAAMILFIGHLLNIILGAMAVLVHGLRLNVLEFSGHLNMEWAGIGYSPLKKKGEK